MKFRNTFLLLTRPAHDSRYSSEFFEVKTNPNIFVRSFFASPSLEWNTKTDKENGDSFKIRFDGMQSPYSNLEGISGFLVRSPLENLPAHDPRKRLGNCKLRTFLREERRGSFLSYGVPQFFGKWREKGILKLILLIGIVPRTSQKLPKIG